MMYSNPKILRTKEYLIANYLRDPEVSGPKETLLYTSLPGSTACHILGVLLLQRVYDYILERKQLKHAIYFQTQKLTQISFVKFY